MNKKLIFLVVSFLYMVTATAQPLLIPYPRSIEIREGYFALTAKTGIINLSDKNNARLLKHYIEEDININLHEQRGDNNIFLITNRKLKESLGAEGYRMNISTDSIVIEGAENAGVFYGIQTLRQLAAQNRLAIPCMEIFDKPEYEWRDFMLDEARHFKGKVVVKQLLEEMAYLKMNKFHWHLTDDQGWRIEIEKYPRLTQVGAYRDSTQIGGWNSPLYDVNIHGGYYTQEDIREIVDFAAERHIEIIPEIEMPGHTSAAIAAYPELGSLKTPPTVATYFNPTWGIFNVADERVIQFIQDVFDEIFDLFPSRYIHIGGDEVHPESWEANSDISRFMKEKNLDNYSEVQMLFTNRVASLIHSKGRTMIGWNDIMGKNIHEWADSDNESTHALAPYAVVQFWKGDTALIAEALKQGHRVINSSHRDTYLDYNYTKIPLKKAYDFSPFPKGIDQKYKPLLLGSGCQMWSEWIPRIEDMQRQVFPRIAAYAESGWTIENKKNFTRFSTSLSQILIPRWKQKNIAWHKESTPQAE